MGGLLRVVSEENFSFERSLLVMGPAGVTRISLEEQAVKVPRMSLLLNGYYETDGTLIDDGKGQLPAATLPYIWEGQRKLVRGVLVPALVGPLLVVPYGFFNGRH
jgi:hypothetical protein